jgi:integrase
VLFVKQSRELLRALSARNSFEHKPSGSRAVVLDKRNFTRHAKAMSIRRRVWTTGKGVEREAWIVDYADQTGKRHLKTFKRKKEAEVFATTTSVEVRRGTHTAEADSITVEEAGKLWIATGERNGLERTTLDAYRQHLDLHIVPYLGPLKLSQLSAPGIRDFEDRLIKDGAN